MSEIGQRAGIFKKHGLVARDRLHAGRGRDAAGGDFRQRRYRHRGRRDGRAQRLLEGRAGARDRAETTGAGDLYWYVKGDSPIKTLKDTDGKTLAYSTNGSSTHGVVTAFMKQYELKAKPTAMGGPAANLTAVMSGQVDVGWAAPPFGLDQLDKGDIRRIATGNDAAVFKGQTVRLNIANANFLAAKKDVVARYMKAYRETVELMYKDDGPEGLCRVAADQRGEGEAHARRILPVARDRAGHDRRARHHREGCGGAEVHRDAAHQGAAGGADPDSAAVRPIRHSA